MSGRILLDANVVVALLNGEQIVLEHLVSANEIFLPSIVLGELYYGAFKSTRVESNLSRIRGFAERNTVLSCTQSRTISGLLRLLSNTTLQ
jgi:tRNA(fMet)-specific endonuclease VapC